MDESIRVEEEGSSSVVEMTELQKEMERWNETSIYRVPAHIKLKDMKYSSAYRPQLVSLGPFHHGDTALLPMEEHKRRALLHLVKRTGKPKGEFVAAVKEAADQLEAAYGQDLDQEWRGDNGRERFVDMMVTDGCFLLEAMLMIEWQGRVPADYAPNDPVFSKHGYLYLKNVILADMFVMENQLPMLLLEKLALHLRRDETLPVRT